jgi:hypothetical protein
MSSIAENAETQSLLSSMKGGAGGKKDDLEQQFNVQKKQTRGFMNSMLFQGKIVTSGFAMFILLFSLVALSFSKGYDSAFGETNGLLMSSLGRNMRHKSHSHSSSSSSSSKKGTMIDVPFADDSEKHNSKASHKKSSKQAKKKEENCDPAEADMAKGIFAYSDQACMNGETAGCSGDMTSGNPSTCRFCNTLMAQVKTPTWATCPQSVCKKHGVLGCEGDSIDDLQWKGYVDGIKTHNKRVEQIGLTSACQGTPADRELGRFMFYDGKCGEKLLPACDGNQVTQCRFCSAAKKASAVSMTWPTCPDVVCARWGIKMDYCEKPLAMYQLPTKRTEKNKKTGLFPDPKLDNVKTEKLNKKTLRDAEDLIYSEDGGSHKDNHLPRAWRMGDDVADISRVHKNFITKMGVA